jgi:hypothetical protein
MAWLSGLAEAVFLPQPSEARHSTIENAETILRGGAAPSATRASDAHLESRGIPFPFGL